MNTYQAQELLSADIVRNVAKTTSCTYADPQDQPAARIALLMLACEREAQSQGMNVQVVFQQEVT
jgi:hypothetical protein